MNRSVNRPVKRPSKRKSRLAAIAAITAAILSGVALFWTAQKVQTADTRLRALHEATASEKQAIHVLHAEWDYLNRPDRLEALAHDHLNMEPPQPGEVVNSSAALPDAMAPPMPASKTAMKAQSAVMRSPVVRTPPAATPPAIPVDPAATAPSAPATRSFQNLLDDLNKNEEADHTP